MIQNIKYYTVLFSILLICITTAVLIIFKIETELSIAELTENISHILTIEAVYSKQHDSLLSLPADECCRDATESYLIYTRSEQNNDLERFTEMFSKEWSQVESQEKGILNTDKGILIFHTLTNSSGTTSAKRILFFDKKEIQDRNGKRFIIYYTILLIISLGLALLFIYFRSKQQALRIREARYLQKLQDKNEKLRQRNREYKEAINTKNRFFSIIAHDLRNPFQVVLGYTGLLLDNSDNMSIDEIKEYFRDIESATGQLMRLLDNLLLWSRAETGSMKMRPSAIDMQHLVDTTISLVQVNANKKGVSLKSILPPKCVAQGDKDMLLTVLRNLMTNAVKFTPVGGHVTVEASLAAEHTMLEIIVKDTGIGMSEENQQKLFRIDKTYSHKGTNGEEGTGLGLVLCHEFIEKHGGSIWVESIEGEGSEFHFTIPHEIATPEMNVPAPS